MARTAKAQPRAEKAKCLACERDAVTRGLCRSCCMSARRAVNSRETTWKKLEAAGLALPKLPRGHIRHPKNFRRVMKSKLGK